MVIYENEHWFVLLDSIPSRPGHMLIVPKRLFESHLEIKLDEWLSLDVVYKEIRSLYEENRSKLKSIYKARLVLVERQLENFASANKDSKEYKVLLASKRFLNQAISSKFLGEKTIDFTIGVNEGEYAGRSVAHLHIHYIPRFKGDVEDPLGGIRAMFPGDGNYLNSAQSLSALEAAMSYYGSESTAIAYFRMIRERSLMKDLNPFLAKVRAGRRKSEISILEIGFGPGIEFQEMLRRGYLQVDGVDISGPMTIELTRVMDKDLGFDWRTNGRLFTYSMQEFKVPENQYDGIWSQATFLHLERAEVAPMINKYAKALKPGGYFHLSFKVGERESLFIDSQGRPFSFFTAESFRNEILPHVEGLELARLEVPEGSKDALKRQVQWLTVVFRRPL